MSKKQNAPTIRVGIGGWNYEPWHETFYPSGVSKAQELSYASRHVTTIEINGTFYRTQTPATFAKWAEATPEDFVFSVKAPRYTTHRRELGKAGQYVESFLNSGLIELGDKLGPILWQFPPTRKFDAAAIESFLALLPTERGGRELMHVLEVRHASFMDSAFVELLRKHNASTVLADSDKYPLIADLAGLCVYARLQSCRADVETGYDNDELASWLARLRDLGTGKAPKDLPTLAPEEKPARTRPVFAYFIAGAKERAPAAAMALLRLIG